MLDRQGPLNVARPVITYPLLSLSTGLGALIYALIINALKKLTPWQL